MHILSHVALIVLMLGTGADAAGSPAPASGACDSTAVLARAARAYRAMPVMAGEMHIDVEIPGAPTHAETTQYGVDRSTTAWIRMPGLYVIAVTDGRLDLAIDDPSARSAYLERPVAGDLQDAVDVAFEGHGSPLVAVPLLLRRAADAEARAQAFRSKLLHRLAVQACTFVRAPGADAHARVQLAADNGEVRADFDAATGLLVELTATIDAGSPGVSLSAHATFAPAAGAVPPRLDAAALGGLRQVARFDDLSGEGRNTGIREAGLRSLNGEPFALDALAEPLLLVEFWARWCAPCRLTMPVLARVEDWGRREHLGIRVVLVATEEDFESVGEARVAIDDYLRAMRVAHETTVDLGSHFHRQVGGGLPLTLLYRRGELIARFGGYDDHLEEHIEARLRASAGN